MCSHLFGKNSGSTEGLIGDVVGGLAGAYFGGPVGAAAGAELGGTVGGVAGGESVGTAAGNALIGAGVAGLGTYAAEDFGGFTPSGGTDLFGVSGTPAAPSAVSAGGFGGVPVGSDVIAGATDTTATAGADGYIDPSTGLPVPPTPPATAPLPGATALPNVTGAAPAGGTMPLTVAPSGTGLSPVGGLAGSASIIQPSGSTGTLQSIADTLGVSKSTLLPAGIAGIGLARDLLSPSTLKGESQLTGEAAQLASQSQTMQNYLTTGTLPPGVQTAINNATAGAKAAIRAKYASQGLSGSSMETQELSQVDLNAVSAGATTAIKLYDQGLQDANISQEIYRTLLSTDVAQQQQTGNAIANLAAALSGGLQPRQQQPASVA